MSQNDKTVAPFGTWKSAISTQLLTAQSVDITAVDVHAPTGKVYYQELRPSEGGRSTIIEYSANGSHEVLPIEYSASSGIHEYGGGDFCVASDGNIIFVDAKTRIVCLLSPSTGSVKPITESDPTLRWADFYSNPTTPKWILAVKEDHKQDPVENYLVVIDSETSKSYPIARGADFYKHPRFSPDGKKVCWIQWNHPDMPWTGTELYIADFNDGKIGKPQYVSGKAISEAVDEPIWGPEGTLFFVSDRTGFLQLYRLDADQTEPHHIKLDGLEDSEFSGRNPAVGSRTYVPMNATTLVAAYTRKATNYMISIDLTTETWRDLKLPLTSVRGNAVQRVSETQFVVIGTAAKAPKALYQYDIKEPSIQELIKGSIDISLPKSLFSVSEHITFPRTHGANKEGVCHCLFSAAHNPDFVGMPGKLPPLIVSLHGGPTSHVSPGLDLAIQYWTSRGYAWADINYTGSSGYGRAYRDALNGEWGVFDTDDFASCVSYLTSAGLVDGSRIGIRGGSAGGYGVLQALCIYPTMWAGGVSIYGVGDVKALAMDTHKFESHYLFKLMFKNGIEGLSDEEIEKTYHDRSPVFHADQITAPVLLLQGSADKVVPPNQSFDMERVIKEKGGEVKVVIFDGEGHGFKRADSVKRAIEEEESWWLRTLVRES